MKILLFGSQFPNLLNYGIDFSNLKDHIFTVTPLVSSKEKESYRRKLAHFLGTEKITIFPIYLQSPDNRFRNLFNPFIFVRDFRSIFKTIKSLSPDAVICFYILDAYPLAVLKRILGYSLFVVATGGDINLREGLVYKLVRTLICHNSDSIFVVSNELKEKIQKESGCKATFIPTAVDSSFFRPLNSKSNLRKKWALGQELVILTVCRLVENKGVNLLIRSMNMLRTRTDIKRDVKLVVVGDGPERRPLEELVSELDLKQNVFFLGFRNREELLELYNIADLFVLTSYSEGLPFTLLEAMACKNICISTNVGGIGTVITEGSNGFLVGCGDPISLTEKIEEILSIPEKKMSCIRNHARKTVLENFDSRNSTRIMMEMIAARLEK